MSLYFWCTFLRHCSCFVATFGQLFTLRPPNFFVLAQLVMLIACWKTNFFRMFMGNFWERNREREIFRLKRFPNKEAKKLFFTLFCALNQTFFAVPVRHRWETCKEKASLLLIKKNKEPGERNVRFWTLILMFIFHEKFQSLGHVKRQKLPCNTHYFWCFGLTLNHPKDWKKKICVFMGNEKRLWTP